MMIKQDGWSHVEPAVRKEKLHIGLFSKTGVTSHLPCTASLQWQSAQNAIPWEIGLDRDWRFWVVVLQLRHRLQA